MFRTAYRLSFATLATLAASSAAAQQAKDIQLDEVVVVTAAKDRSGHDGLTTDFNNRAILLVAGLDAVLLLPMIR